MVDLSARHGRLSAALGRMPVPRPSGRLIEVTGTSLRALVPDARIGNVCGLLAPSGEVVLEAEVVGFRDGFAVLTAMGDIADLGLATDVTVLRRQASISFGRSILGRVINSAGQPIDGRGELRDALHKQPLYAAAPRAMDRPLIARPFSTGLRVIDGVLTMGEGQRIGIFGPAGVGKSHLIAALCRAPSADVTVLALVGERGREVREFLDKVLSPEARARTVMVVETSDASAASRARAAYAATALAEGLRDDGLRVLLLVDSLTRTARALRDVGLSAGEPMGRGGWPNSVYAKLAPLLERAGPAKEGMITAIYTILSENDDSDDPLSDEIRSILDGHVILSRDLAASNHFPAIDITKSRSRIMDAVVSAEHLSAAGHLRKLVVDYEEIAFLRRVGEFQEGADPAADRAVALHEDVLEFLQQDSHDQTRFEDMLDALFRVTGEGHS